jgi:protein-S-isoprenylcysteine O-methyltransferase Ste14
MTVVAPPPAPGAAPSFVPERLVVAGEWLFRNRGWIPAPAAALMLLGAGEMSWPGWAGGGAAMAAGEALRLWGVAAAGVETRRRSRDVATLVTHGPFALTRNPIYAGNLLLWMGFCLVAGAPWFIPVAVALFAVEYGLIVRFEESVLAGTFGAEYERYRARTPRWVPRRPAIRATGRLDWAAAMRRETLTLALIAALLAVVSAGQWPGRP